MHHVHSTGTGAGTTFSTVRWCLFGSREHAPAHSRFTQSWALRVKHRVGTHGTDPPTLSRSLSTHMCVTDTVACHARNAAISFAMQFSSLLDSAARGRKRPNVPTRTQHSQTEHRHAHKVSRPHCSAYGTLCTGCSTTTLTVEYVLELVYETSTRLLQLYSSRSQTDTSFIPSERSRFDGLPIDTPAPRARERGRSSQLAVLEPLGFVPFTARCPRAIWFRSVHSSLSSSQFVAFRVLDTSDRVAALGAGSSALDA